MQVNWTLENNYAKCCQAKCDKCLSGGCLHHFIILLSWLCECHSWLQTWCCCPHIWLGYTHASMSNVPIAHHLVRLTLICSSPSPQGRLHRLWDLWMETAGDTGRLPKPLPSAAHPATIIQMTTMNGAALPLKNSHALTESQFDLLWTSKCPTTDFITCCSPTMWLHWKNDLIY